MRFIKIKYNSPIDFEYKINTDIIQEWFSFDGTM